MRYIGSIILSILFLQSNSSFAQEELYKSNTFKTVLLSDSFTPNFVIQQFQEYNSNGNKLVLKSKRTSNTGIHLSYQHYYLGFPVYDSDIQAHKYHNDLSLLLVQNNLESLPHASPKLNVQNNNKKFSWYQIKDKWYLAEIKKGGTQKHPTNYLQVGDKKYEEEYSKLYYHGPDSLVKAKVFMINPINTAKVNYGGNYTDNKDSTNSSLDSQLVEVEMRVKYRNDTFFIGNERFQFRNVIDPPYPEVYSLKDTFFFNRSDSVFEDVNAFYHLNNFADYITNLGYSNLLYDTLIVDPNAGYDDASAFDPAPTPKTLEYGLGNVDDAEDGEVVIHEMIHSLSTKASPLTVRGNERAAMEEGNADYFATSYSLRYTNFNSWKVFSWDGHNEFWDGFVSNSTKNYKTDLTGFTNQDREIWSSALMCIHEKIGAPTMDSLVLEHFFYQAKNTTMPQMANILLKIDSLQNQGAHNWAIKSCFVDQGILDKGSVTNVTPSKNIKIKNSLAFAYGEGNLEVELPTNKNFEMEIVNVHGQLILNDAVQNEYILNPSKLTSGSYFLIIKSDDQVYRIKLLKY